MKKYILFSFAFALSISSSAATVKSTLYLVGLSKTEHKLSIVDPNNLKIIAQIPIGEDPHEVVTSSDGKIAYVSNTGSGRLHEINVIDLVNHKALPSIDIAPLLGPHGMSFTDGKLWFTAEGSKSVGRVDPATNKVEWLMGVGQNRSHMLQVSKDSKQFYVANVDSGNISIFDNLLLPPPIPPIGKPLPTAKPQMGWLQTIIPAGKGAEGFDISPDKKELWIANAHDASISIIDIATKKVTATLDTKTLGISRVAFTPDGTKVLISSLRNGDLLVYNAKTRKEIKKLNLGVGAAHILISPDGNRAFVSCTPAHYISIIDLVKLEMTGNLKIGDRPDGLAWAEIPNP